MREELQEGFALPLAVLAVGLLALGLVLALPSNLQVRDEVGRAQALLGIKRIAITAESRISFLLLTEPVGNRGLEIDGPRLATDGGLISGLAERRPLLFDGRRYVMDLGGGQQAYVRLQDEAGLIDLNRADTALVARLLMICGLPGTQANRLAGDLLRRRGTSAGNLDSGKIDAWIDALPADRRPAVEAAISVTSIGGGHNARTSPEAVRRAMKHEFEGSSAGGGRSVTVESNITNLNIIGSHFGGNYDVSVNKRQKISNTVRIYIAFVDHQLTDHLPDYFYMTALSAVHGDPMRSFLPQRAQFNAGNGAACAESPLEAAAPFPYPGQSVP
jgi:hypothetical protein